MFHKFCPAEVKSFDDKEMTIDHFISTEAKDRSKDIVRADGMKLDGTPSVLKQHGFDTDTGREPIARCLDIRVATNAQGVKGILCKTKYYDGSGLTPPDNTGRRLYEKARDGFMPWWSIGFDVEKEKLLGDGGRDILVWWCYEYSQVGVPDNVTAETVKSFDPKDARPEDIILFTYEEQPSEFKTLNEFYAGTVECDITKPYANEHACRLREPVAGAPTRRKNGAREHNGKKYDVIFQKQRNKWVEQAYRYPKKTWTAGEAKAHCKSHDGILFEPAKKQEKTIGIPVDDIKTLEALGLSTEDGAQVEIGGIQTEVLRVTDDDKACFLLVDTEKAGDVLWSIRAVQTYVKSLTERLAGRVPVEALVITFDTFMMELIYNTDAEKDVRALVKEFARIIEKYALEFFTEVHEKSEEEKAKCYKSIIPTDDGETHPSPSAPGGAPGVPAPGAGPSPQAAPPKSPVLVKIKPEAGSPKVRVGVTPDRIAELARDAAKKIIGEDLAQLHGRVSPQK